MAAITPQEAIDAQYDAAVTIAGFANSSALTVPSRIGGTKKTIAGIVAQGDTAVQRIHDIADRILLPKDIFSTSAKGVSKGVKGIVSLVGGTGGTNGSFDLAFSGGAGSGAAGRFTVVGGIVTSVTLTQAGVDYTSAPTISFVASSGLTGASATAVIDTNTGVNGYYGVPTGVDGESLAIYQNVAGTPTFVITLPSAVINAKAHLMELVTGLYTTIVRATETTGASKSPSIYRSATCTGGVTYEFEVIAKKGTRKYLQLISAGAFISFIANFDLNTASAAGDGVSPVVATDLGGGMIRCMVTFTPGTTETSAIQCRFSDQGVFPYTGNGSYLHILRMQLRVAGTQTNLFPSDDPANAAFSKQDCTTSTVYTDYSDVLGKREQATKDRISAVEAKINGNVFSKFVEGNGASQSPSVYTAILFVNASSYQIIIEAKKAERTRLNVFNNAGLLLDHTFDLNAGTCTGTGATMEAVAGGSWLCKITKAASASSYGNIQLRTYPASGGHPYTGDGTSGLLVRKAELYKDGATTNLFLEPTDFTSLVWSKQNVTVTPNAALSGGIQIQANQLQTDLTTLNVQVNGEIIGDKFVEGSGASQSPSVYQYVTWVNGSAYEIGVLAKKAERTRLNLYSPVGAVFDCTFDLANGTCTGTGASMTSTKAGEWLCKVNKTAVSSTSNNLQLRVFPASGGQPYTGDGVSGLYVAKAYQYKDGVQTNLLTGNNDFTNGSSWSLQNVTVTPNVAKFGGIDSAVTFDDGHVVWSGKKVTTIGTSMEAGNAWQPTLAAALNVTVVNLGVSGASYGANAHYGSLGVYQSITTGVPGGSAATGGSGVPADSAVVIMGGPYNDFGVPTPTPLGALGDTTTATFYGALYASLVAIMTRAPNAQIIMLTAHSSAPLISGVASTYRTGYTNGLGNKLEQFQEAMKITAAAYGVGFIDAGREAGIGLLTAAANTSDGLHLDATYGGPLYGGKIVEGSLQLARAHYIRA